MGRDWVEWHEAYERPESSLTERLRIVIEMLRAAFDGAAAGELRCLSLCAGDARDVAGALTGHARASDVVGAVVELDEQLAMRASQGLADVAPGLAVRVGDAGDPEVFGDIAPVDVLVLVGIFGNISDSDIRRTIGEIPRLCRPDATVLWSRHRRAPDATPMIRKALDDVGCTSIRFESPGAGSFAIGAERFAAPSDGRPGDRGSNGRLFTFRDDLW